MSNFDFLSEDGVMRLLKKKDIRVTLLDSVDSTNLYAKRHASTLFKNQVIIAKEQTSGKGRLDRTFFSPQNTGIYMSIFLKPELLARESVLITTAAAVAVCKACEKLGSEECKIKWVNDVFINNKKVCGILTEGAINPKDATLEYAILGIGINVYHPKEDFDKQIKDIAGCVFEDKAKGLMDKLAAETINNFYEYYDKLCLVAFLTEYRNRSCITGEKVDVIKGDSVKTAKVLKIEDDFSLLVEYDDMTRERLISGEVSLKRKD